jgi:DNA-directed RNA polymerase subunit alpha
MSHNIKFSPKLNIYQESTKDKKQVSFIIAPLERGYGITVGNALRRVLLSSIPGFAISSIIINGVSHEFSTIEGVSEDVMNIILNLKKVVIKADEPDPDFSDTLELNVVGPCIVRASDFSGSSLCEIVNPDQIIATLGEGARLEMVVKIRCGKGYVSANENKRSLLQVGEIFIDSFFSPIVRVAFSVDHVLGGADELHLNIETNGALEAKEALGIATKMLSDYLLYIYDQCATRIDQYWIKEEEDRNDNQILDISFENLNPAFSDFPSSLVGKLKRSIYKNIRDLIEAGEDALDNVGGFGDTSKRELSIFFHNHKIDLLQSHYAKAVAKEKKALKEEDENV